jgi:hypothetical protein
LEGSKRHDSIRGEEFLEQLSDYQLLKKNLLYRVGEVLVSELVSLMALIF